MRRLLAAAAIAASYAVHPAATNAVLGVLVAAGTTYLIRATRKAA
jgi:hypothetical protein